MTDTTDRSSGLPVVWGDYLKTPLAFATGADIGGSTGIDFVMRIQSTANTLFAIGQPTVDFSYALHNAIFAAVQPTVVACKTLGLVIDRLKLREMYSNYYRDFLVGNLTEDEFKQVSEDYAYSPSTPDPVELDHQIRTLLAYTTEEFTANEVAELLRVREQDVESVIHSQFSLTGRATTISQTE